MSQIQSLQRLRSVLKDHTACFSGLDRALRSSNGSILHSLSNAALNGHLPAEILSSPTESEPEAAHGISSRVAAALSAVSKSFLGVDSSLAQSACTDANGAY